MLQPGSGRPRAHFGPMGTEGRRTGTGPPCGHGDGRRPAGRRSPLAYSAALPMAWAPVDSSHSEGSSAPLLWAYSTDGSSRGVWRRRTRRRGFLHGGPQRPLAGGRWIGRRRGGGLYRRRAVAVRRRACSAPAVQGSLAAASLPGVASPPGVAGRHAARCTRRSAAASVASISAGFAGGEPGAWVPLSDGRPRVCARSGR